MPQGLATAEEFKGLPLREVETLRSALVTMGWQIVCACNRRWITSESDKDSPLSCL